nr:ulp1 protease family, C-terminal catalytic domain-containing protein [Ipomoea batatas]
MRRLKRLVGVVPVVAGVWGVVGGPFTVVPRVGSTFVCLAPRKANRPARTVLGSVRRSGVHSIASVPSLDLLNDLNFFKWVLKHEFLFPYIGQTVSRNDICSLAPWAEVSVGVIIAGSCILTCREHTNDPSTPTRVFASPFTTLNTTVLFKKIDKLKLTRFSEALGADFALGHYKIWGHVHLLFFPILQQNHLYLLCVDFKFEWLEIIDNSASTQPTPVKYGDTPENVKFKSIVCDNLKTKRMSMTWRDTKNKVDYGMYLMRHMESYVSEAVKVLQNGIVGLLVVTDRNFRGYVCVI